MTARKTLLGMGSVNAILNGALIPLGPDPDAGAAPTTGVIFFDGETPAGTINGTDGTDGTAAFTLANTPTPAASLILLKTDVGTAVVMIAGVHYNLSGNTITYTAGNRPISGQSHRAFYRYGPVAVVGVIFYDNETPAGTINGTDGTDGTAAFTLENSPSPAASLLLVKTDIGTGVQMVAGVHYNLSGNTITYTTGNRPISGQAHRAAYRFGPTISCDENFADSETPAGTINGTDGTDGTAAFTLANTPSPAGSLLLVKTDIGTGVQMVAGIHFNLSGATITYTAGNRPISGQTHRAWYRY